MFSLQHPPCLKTSHLKQNLLKLITRKCSRQDDRLELLLSPLHRHCQLVLLCTVHFETINSRDRVCVCVCVCVRSVELLQRSFASLSFDDKVRIIHKEQPMSDLRIHTLSWVVKVRGGGISEAFFDDSYMKM